MGGVSNDVDNASSAPRRIVVVRHAKAVQESINDHERSLAGRGRKNAPAAGRWLSGLGIVPDLVVCSTAARTRETWELLSGELERRPEVVFDERLYGASPDELLAVIRETPEGVGSLMVVGHNPTMHAVAYALDGGDEGESPSGNGLIERLNESGFPTSAVAVLDVRGRWAEVERGSARLAEYWTPRD